MPILTKKPQTEPIIIVTLYGTRLRFMIETGATCSSIGKDGANLPLSASKIRTVGFSGKAQIIPVTEPVPLEIRTRTVYTSLVYSANAPLNLLGRDALCQLQAEIKCTPSGIYFDIANQQPDTLPLPMMPLTVPAVTPQMTHHVPEAQVYWMKLTTPDSFLYHGWEAWRPLVMYHDKMAKEPTLPYHCTMMYDQDQTCEDFEQSWDEIINNKTTVIQYEDIIVGAQGATATVKLQHDVEEWFQVPGSAPNVTLLIADQYESQDLGPMVKAAKEIKDWITSDCPQISLSPDGSLFKILFTLADEAVAQRVKVCKERTRHMVV